MVLTISCSIQNLKSHRIRRHIDPITIQAVQFYLKDTFEYNRMNSEVDDKIKERWVISSNEA